MVKVLMNQKYLKMLKNSFNKILKIILWILAVLITVIILISISNIIKTPSHDRQWSEDSKILPSISVNENTIEVKNIRDWRYSRTEILSKEYYDESFDLNKLEKTYYLINPFGKWNGVAHGFFLFVFEDGKSVSVSIEARREADESFNSIKGLFNKYELWYTYGSAADFITRRAVHYEDNELNMYPLLISKEMSQKLFLDLANETQSIEKEARFYNTLKSNCTNLLMDSLNKAKKGTVPFHYSRLFTGYSDDYFYKLGLIPNDASFEEINKKFRIDDEVLEIDYRLKEYTKEEFWNEFLKIIKSDFNAKIIRWDDWDRSTKVNPPETYNRPAGYKIYPTYISEGGDVPDGIKFDSFRVEMPSDVMSKYENVNWGIKFEYPSNYIVKEVPERNYVGVDYPKWTAGRDGLGGVSITLTEMTYEEFKEAVNKPEQYSGIIEEKEFVIDGKKANLLVHSTAIGLDRYVVFVEHKGKNFYIDYPEHPVQREIFNSIKFI